MQDISFEDDGQALHLLESRGYDIVEGTVFGKLTPELEDERKAIDYLCSEWDYCFFPAPGAPEG